MYNANIPTNQEVPSTGKLVKSTILAAVTAGALLVTVVMPAEYGIDPTGVGNAIGLKKMGEIKTSLAEEAAADEAKDVLAEQQSPSLVSDPVAKDTPATLNHEMKVTLAPDEGTEIKVAMSKGSTVQYEWWTDGGKANFDAHADSKELDIDYHSYEKGSEQKKVGTIEAAFDGSHGWFWRNRTSTPLTITLKTNGEYTDIKHMK
jgi:hypothetical protein